MRYLLVILSFVIAVSAIAQEDHEVKGVSIEKKLRSEYFQKERVVKVHLPQDFDSTQRYPVIYTLDGFELFSITCDYARYLIKYDVIPSSIIVSVYHNDRNYETSPNYGQNVNVPLTEYLEGSEKLKNHLLNEVKPLIDGEYLTSGYNVLIGHSNTATFVNEMISKDENPFQAFIAISPDLLDEQLAKVAEYLSNVNNKKVSYFVSSGLKDDQYRLATGNRLDTIFRPISNNQLRLLHQVYSAGHKDLVPKSLNDALIYIFSEYRNYDDFMVKSSGPNFSAKAYLEEKIQNTNSTYGINSTLNEDDFFYIAEKVAAMKNKQLLSEMLDVSEQNKFYVENHLFSDKAQWYEQASFYEEALANWKLQIENGYYQNIFYFERPFRLLDEQLKRPEEGIEFLRGSMKKYPKGTLIFNYWIAKSVLENKLPKNIGLEAVEYCIDNFKANSKFSLEDARSIRSRLQAE